MKRYQTLKILLINTDIDIFSLLLKHDIIILVKSCSLLIEKIKDVHQINERILESNVVLKNNEHQKQSGKSS